MYTKQEAGRPGQFIIMRRALISSKSDSVTSAFLLIRLLLICLLVLPEHPPARCQQVVTRAPDEPIEIRIGFLVARQQCGLKSNAQAGRTYSSRPGRLMSYVFNFALDKLNAEFNFLGAEMADTHHAPATGELAAAAEPLLSGSGAARLTSGEQLLRPAEVDASRPLIAQARNVRLAAPAQRRTKSNATFLNTDNNTTTTNQDGSDIDVRQVPGARAQEVQPDDDGDTEDAAQEAARRRIPKPVAVIFKPLLAETCADEAESIKQTIDLITRQKAHVILGPQASTCQVEPIIAAIYNVPMLSHYCSHDHTTGTIGTTSTITTGASSAASSAFSSSQSTPTSDDHQHNERLVTNSVVDQHQSRKIPLHQIVNGAAAGLHANTFIQSKPPVWKIVKRVISLLRNLIDRKHDRAYELVLLYYKERPPLPVVEVGRASTVAAVEAMAGAALIRSPPDAWKPRDAEQNLLLTNNHGRVTTPWWPATNERLAASLGHHKDGDETEDEQEEGEEGAAAASARSGEADRFKIIGQLLEIKLSRLVGVGRRRTVDSTNLREAQTNSTSPPLVTQITKDQSAASWAGHRPASLAPSAHSLSVLNWHTTFHYGYMRNPFRQVLRRHLLKRQRLAQQRNWQSSVLKEMASTDHHQWSGRCESMRAGARPDGLTSSGAPAQSPATSSIYIVVGHYYEHLGLMLALDELGLIDESELTTNDADSQTPAADDDDDGDRRQTKRPSAPYSPMADAAANRLGQWLRNGGARRQHRRQPAIVIGVDIEPYDEGDDSVRFLRGLLLDGAQPTMNPSATLAVAGDNPNEQSANSLASRYNSYLGVTPAKPSKSVELLDEMRYFYKKTQKVSGGAGSGEDHQQQQDLKLAQTILQLRQQQQQQQQQQFKTDNASLLSIYDSNLLALKMLQFARLPVEAYYLYDTMMLLGAYYAECLAGDANLARCSEGQRMFTWFAGRKYSGYTDQLGSRFDANGRAEGSYSLLARRMANTVAQMRHNNSLSEGLLEGLGDDEFDIGPIARFEPPHDTIEFQVAPVSIAPMWWPLWCASNDRSSARINSTIDCSIYHSTTRDALTANQNSTNGDANGHLVWPLIGLTFSDEINLLVAFVAALICLCLICVCLVATIAFKRAEAAAGASGTAGLSLNQLLLGCQSATEPDNSSWFGARDVRNFLQIVHELLLMPDDSLINEAHERDEVSEWLAAAGKLAQLSEGDPNERLKGSARNHLASATRQDDKPSGNLSHRATYGVAEEATLKQNIAPTFHLDRSLERAAERTDWEPVGSVAIDLHCYMFAFPSCKFVHWLTALHKLKELLFKYQSNLSGATGDIESGATAEPPRQRATLLQCADDRLIFQLPTMLRNGHPKSGQLLKRLRNKKNNNNNTNTYAGNNCATFFTGRHKHTATLRLLLNKYKATNERLCQLSQLKHPNLVRLLGLTLANDRLYGLSGSKMARLLLERPERGNLRKELRKLSTNQQLGARAAGAFRCSLCRPLLADLLSGLEFLHEHPEIGFHGQINATNCLLTADWRLKLSGFHVTHMRRSLGQYKMRLPVGGEDSAPISKQQSNKFVCSRDALGTTGKRDCLQDEGQDELDASVYMAPEVLSHAEANVFEGGRAATTALGEQQMRLADIYAFAFVAFELLTSQEPWSCRADGNDDVQLSNGNRHRGRAGRLIAERVKVDSSFRPPIGRLDKILPILSHHNHQRVASLAANYWQVESDNEDDGDDDGDEDADCLGRDNFLLDASSNLLMHGAVEPQISQQAAGIGARLQHAGDKLKRLLEACWSKDPSARPQSARALRIGLHEAGFVTSAASASSISTRQLDDHSLQEPGRGSLLKLYTKLLERASSARQRKLLSERQISGRLRLALLPAINFVPAHSALTSFSRHHERVFVCLFRFLSLGNVTQIGWPQFETLNGLLGQLDERIESYRGHLHLWDSQVDSMMRFMVCASEPSPLESGESGQRFVRKSPAIPYNRIKLLTTFAFELIDMANEWQSKFEGQIQVRCALHLGQAGGLCLIRPPVEGARNAIELSQVLKLARYVLSGPAVEVAKIIEQSGQPQRIHISADYKAALLLEHEQEASFGVGSHKHQFKLKSLLPSILGDDDANLATADQHQCYVIIRRSNRIQAKGFDQDTYWLLNGPRVTASQRLMLPLKEGRPMS